MKLMKKHADLKKDVLKATKSRLDEIFYKKSCSRVLSKPRYYFVDNTTAGTPQKDPNFEQLRAQVQNFKCERIDTPTTWVLFRKVLQRVCEKKATIQYSETEKVAMTCTIPLEDVESVLEFLSSTWSIPILSKN